MNIVILSVIVEICGDLDADYILDIGLLSALDRSVYAISVFIVIILSVNNLFSLTYFINDVFIYYFLLALVGVVVGFVPISNIFLSLFIVFEKILPYLPIGLTSLLIFDFYFVPTSYVFLLKAPIFYLEGVTTLISDVLLVIFDSFCSLDTS